MDLVQDAPAPDEHHHLVELGPMMTLLRQNRRLAMLGIYQWTLPAWVQRLPDGRALNVCPSAGVCSEVCYAREGTYRIPSVHRRHIANLAYVVDDLPGWEAEIRAELHATTRSGELRFRNKWVRIHDSGDFFSVAYLQAWLRIIRATPETRFYCYTKEVLLFREWVEPDPPKNLSWVYSYGGRHDALLDEATDRVADVFPNESDLAAAGYHSQAENDLLAVAGPAPVGIVANRLPGARARQAGRRLSEWQAGVDAARRERIARHSGSTPVDGGQGSAGSSLRAAVGASADPAGASDEVHEVRPPV